MENVRYGEGIFFATLSWRHGSIGIVTQVLYFTKILKNFLCYLMTSQSQWHSQLAMTYWDLGTLLYQ